MGGPYRSAAPPPVDDDVGIADERDELSPLVVDCDSCEELRRSDARVDKRALGFVGALTLAIISLLVIGFPETPCEKSVASAFPEETSFDFRVRYETSAALRGDDFLQIDEVLGTAPQFKPGAVYRVRGKYTLRSRAYAQLSLSLIPRRAGEWCLWPNRHSRVDVSHGTGAFDLAIRVPFSGYPVLELSEAGDMLARLYFGDGEFSYH